MQSKITPFLWYEKDLDKVFEYYQNIFNKNEERNFKILNLGEKQNTGRGEFQTGSFKLFESKFDAMAAGPMFKFTEAISFTISCEDQDEVNYYWNAITADGGQESFCGWCKDKYGLSFQIIPKKLIELNTHKDAEIRNYSLLQMMKMGKIIIKDLEKKK